MSSTTSHSLTISARDGFPLAATLFRPEAASKRLVLLCSGTGIRQGYYHKFARFLAENDFIALTFDYRGIGASRPSTLRGFSARMQDWAQQDIAGVAHWCAREFQPERFFFVGHSVGGQLAGLAGINQLVHGMVLVAAQSGYWRHWPWHTRHGIAALWNVMPLFARMFGYLPGNLGIGEALPLGVATEWAKWGRHRRYLFGFAHELEVGHYQRLAVPILAYSFWDDIFAPKPAVEALLQEYSSANIIHRHLTPATSPTPQIGHFGFFREHFRASFWQETLTWLQKF